MSIHPDYFQPDVVRVDVIASHLPQHFLGTAFDLNFPADWQFDHEELCGIFFGKDPDIFQLVSPLPATRRVVFGLAVGGGGFDDPSDGCLARFYFHVKDLQSVRVTFEHMKMSVYQNGRRDLADVRWESGFLNLPADTQQTFRTRQPDDTEQFVALAPEIAGTDLLQSLEEPSLINVYIVLFVALGLVVAIFVGVWAYFRLRRKD